MHGRGDQAGPFLDRAIAAGRKAIELDPKDTEALISMGNALGNEGHMDEARPRRLVPEHQAASDRRPPLRRRHRR